MASTAQKRHRFEEITRGPASGPDRTAFEPRIRRKSGQVARSVVAGKGRSRSSGTSDLRLRVWAGGRGRPQVREPSSTASGLSMLRYFGRNTRSWGRPYWPAGSSSSW